MKALLGCLALVGAMGAAPPPVIDRELFFGDPEISAAQISPDGKYLAFLKPWNKTRNIWVKRTGEPFGAAKVVTNDTRRPITGYFWSRDAKYILYVQDKAGDENFNVYAVNPADSAPAARGLTEAAGVRAVIYAVPKTEPDALFVGLNDRDKAWHDLYKVKISTGQRTLLRKNTGRITGWVFDLKDQLRLATRSADNGDTEILRVDAGGFTKIYSCGVFDTCGPLRFHKDGRRFYAITNQGDRVDLIRLALLDSGSGKLEPVESDPEKRVDFQDAVFSELSDELAATTYLDEKQRTYFRDKAFEADYQWLTGKLPGKEIRYASRTRDERMWLVTASADTEPGETYLFDRQARKLTLEYRTREKLPREQLAPMQAIRYRSSDGLEIPAYLTLPLGVPPKNLPLIVFPHGGPWGRDTWGYGAFPQFLANRGYAVLQPNFRASTGYGKKFLNAGNREWGRKMQDDLTWGVKHLVAEGIADPKRVGIMGGSYGGYAALAGAAFTPEVYAAAVSIMGPSNLITLLGSIPPYWEQVRKMFHERMGDPGTPEGRAELQRQSPLYSAAKIRTPLMVAQGANDPRVNQAESDQIVAALRDRGFPVEYLVAPDEGHGFARPVNNLAMIAAAEKFLAKHLGGRYQEDATPEVAARLKEITVDPKTVAPAKKINTPAPVSGLHPGTLKYKGKIQLGDRSMEAGMVTTIAEEGGSWRVTESIQLPMGEVIDTAVLEKGTLFVRTRSIKQGPVGIEMSFEGGKVAGSMNMGGQQRPIAVDLGGPAFAEAAAAHTLACLPLAEGYTVTYLNVDLQKQKPRLMRVRKPVKVSTVMAAMGGATVTAGLTE